MTVAVDKSPEIKSQRHPLDATCINTIRTLAMDAVQAANSGHPGTPMAMAPVAYCLWQTSSASTPTTRSGPTATASCSRPAMPRCCSIRCCT